MIAVVRTVKIGGLPFQLGGGGSIATSFPLTPSFPLLPGLRRTEIGSALLLRTPDDGRCNGVSPSLPTPAAAKINRLLYHAEILALKDDSFRLQGKDLVSVPAGD